MKDDEAARMAAVLPNPKRMRVEPASPFVQERKDWILKNMMNLSGIAYYSYPEPEVIEDSVQVDSSFSFDVPFINRIEISNAGLFLNSNSSISATRSDSSVSDSVKSQNLRFN
jgi:hypothetical protein